MKGMRQLPLLLCFFSLSSCVGSSLSDTTEFEMFPLRAASNTEAKGLKRCLKSAHSAQEEHRKKTGRYFRKVQDLPLESPCNGFILRQKRTPSGYEILAELHEDETAVRWSVNEKGVIEEHLDSEGEPDLEL